MGPRHAVCGRLGKAYKSLTVASFVTHILKGRACRNSGKNTMMKAIQRSKTRYVVYKGPTIAWQIIRHMNDRKWHVHSWRGDYQPQHGQDSPLKAAAVYGLDITEWAHHKEGEAINPVARARAIIGSVLSRAREHSGA